MLPIETAQCRQTRAVYYPLQSEISEHAQKPLIMPGTMDINAGYVNATFERLLCTCISRGFFIGLSLDFAFCACNHGIATGSGPVGLGKLPSQE